MSLPSLLTRGVHDGSACGHTGRLDGVAPEGLLWHESTCLSALEDALDSCELVVAEVPFALKSHLPEFILLLFVLELLCGVCGVVDRGEFVAANETLPAHFPLLL